MGPSDRLLKFIKFDTLSLDEELNLVGFEEQMEQIKTDFPEIFDPKLLVAGKADSADSKPVNKPLSASEKQAALVLGR